MTGEARPPIDTALVRRLVAGQFPNWAGHEVRPVAVGGWNNKAFHLGEDMVVRLPRAAAYADQVDKEQRWLPVLGPLLPLPVPVPLAIGQPAEGYPWRWSVYRWIEGLTAAAAVTGDECELAANLAAFLRALQAIATEGGPPPGRHNFFRGGALSTYDAQTRAAITACGDRIDGRAATDLWDLALSSTWQGAPVWLHGDFAAGNLLLSDGRLSAVIDFGNLAVGDPACDLAIAWTLLTEDGRAAFRAALPLDDGTWARGRGWTLWKALILFGRVVDGHPRDVADAGRVLAHVLADDGRR